MKSEVCFIALFTHLIFLHCFPVSWHLSISDPILDVGELYSHMYTVFVDHNVIVRSIPINQSDHLIYTNYDEQFYVYPLGDSLVVQMVKRLPAMRETRVRFLGREDPWRRKWQSTPALLPGKSHGRRSLIGYSPWGRIVSDMTERLHFSCAVLNCSVVSHSLWPPWTIARQAPLSSEILQPRIPE